MTKFQQSRDQMNLTANLYVICNLNVRSELSKVEQFLRYSKITVICIFKKDDVTEMQISSKMLNGVCNSFFLVKGYKISKITMNC